MNRREKILAAAVLLLGAVWLGNIWFGKYRQTLAARRAAVQDATARLADVNFAIAAGRRAVQQLEAWQAQSLPENRERALSLYKAWLLSKAEDAGLAVEDIKPSARAFASEAYNTIGYRIEATGPLTAVAAMLYEFYRSPQLHQITQLRLARPVGDSPLRITLEVEALCLPGALATDTLPEGESKRLRLASVDDYKKILGERDLVNVYKQPGSASDQAAAPAPQATAQDDDSQSARFSATVPGANGLQAWINVNATGETLHFYAGDELKIGTLEARIISVEPRALVLQTGDKKFRIVLGQTLRGGKEIDADASAASDPPIRPRLGPAPPG